jgi:hypothetical protein
MALSMFSCSSLTGETMTYLGTRSVEFGSVVDLGDAIMPSLVPEFANVISANPFVDVRSVEDGFT